MQTVVAPALGGIVVGQEVGRQLGVRTMFTERKEGTMQLRRGFEIVPGERVLVCEDVVTTGGSVNEVIALVRQAGGEVAGVSCIVDRSGGTVTFPGYAGQTYRRSDDDRGDVQTGKLSAVRERDLPRVKPGSRGNR